MLLLLPILLFVSLTWGKSKSNSELWRWKAVVFAMILCAAWPIEVRERRSAIDTMFVVYGLALQTMCAWSAAWAVSRFLPVNWLNAHCAIGADAFCWLGHAEHGDTVNAFLITLGIVAALTLSYVVIMVEMLVVVTGHSWLARIIAGVLLLVFLLFKRKSA